MVKRGEDSKPDKDLEDRLRSLESRLDERLKSEQPTGSGPTGSGNENSRADKGGFAKALKLSSEFISAILVGAGIGYGLDYLIGTRPWGMIIFLLLGFIAGVVNVLRSSGELADPYRSGWALNNQERQNSLADKPSDKEE